MKGDRTRWERIKILVEDWRPNEHHHPELHPDAMVMVGTGAIQDLEAENAKLKKYCKAFASDLSDRACVGPYKELEEYMKEFG